MTRHELMQARAYKAALDQRRFLMTVRASRRGDLRYCYARMMARKPDELPVLRYYAA